MIQLPIDIKPELKNEVLRFCSNNNLEWCNVYSECWLEGVHGTPKDIENLSQYIKTLEQKQKDYRKTKSFLWKILNFIK